MAAELDIHSHGVDGVAALEDVAELLGELGVVEVAALGEGCEGVAGVREMLRCLFRGHGGPAGRSGPAPSGKHRRGRAHRVADGESGG